VDERSIVVLGLIKWVAELSDRPRNYFGVGTLDPDRPLVVLCEHKHPRMIEAVSCALASGATSVIARSRRGVPCELHSDAAVFAQLYRRHLKDRDFDDGLQLLERWITQRVQSCERTGDAITQLTWNDGTVTTLEAP